MDEETGLAVADGPPTALVIYDPGDDVIEGEAREVGQDELLRGYDDETRRLVDAKEMEVAEAEADEKAARAEARAAKESLETLEAELRRLIRNRREGRGKKPEVTLFTGADEDAPTDAEVVAEANPLDTVWQDYPLSRWTDFGLTEKQIQNLQSAGISTVGDLADYTKPNDAGYAKKLTDIKGIGKAVAERIEEANSAFWMAWNNGVGEKYAREKGVRL